tara:strand:+ start:956 stop:1237 length:282 start_codon:yes stop_codon:yes gene_type:complete
MHPGRSAPAPTRSAWRERPRTRQALNAQYTIGTLKRPVTPGPSSEPESGIHFKDDRPHSVERKAIYAGIDPATVFQGLPLIYSLEAAVVAQVV